MKNILLTFTLLFYFFQVSGQDIDYARKLLDKLSSKGFHGRGYVKNGDRKAADYLAKQFKKNGVLPLDSTYFQPYQFPINTFRGKIKVAADGKKLRPGHDFVISLSSDAVDGTFPLKYLPDTISSVTGFAKVAEAYKDSGYYLVTTYFPRSLYGKTIDGIEGVVVIEMKTPGWHVSNGDTVQQTTWLKFRKPALSNNAKTITVRAKNTFEPAFETQNVLGMVKGKLYPDRYITFSAHYDHLGMMGNRAWFAGANDNASGTAMVLDLARHYALPENQPDYSIVFMLISGEEAGLKGSGYYATHPFFPLQQISMLINLDMVGTGSEGITVVNGKAYNNVIMALNEINDQHNYVPEIKARGEACNSDHCPFYKIGVKSIFIYTRGEEHLEYHTVNDVKDDFPFTAYSGLFRLLTGFVEKIQE